MLIKNLLIILSFIIILAGQAHAMGCNSMAGSIIQYGNSIEVNGVPCTSLSGISERLNNASKISNISGVWNINAQINVYNSILYLNSSDVSDIRWDAEGNQYALFAPQLSAVVKMNNISIIGWDSVNNTYKNNTNTGRIYIMNGSVSDLSLRGMEQLRIYHPFGDIYNISVNDSMDLWFENMNNQTIANIVVTNGRSGAFYLYNSSNMTVYNISVKDIPNKIGIHFQSVTNSTAHHLSVVNLGYGPDSGGQAIQFTGGGNIIGHDFYMDNIGRSAFSPTGHLNGAYFYNIIINRDGHNGIDFHPASNILVENITVTNSSGNSFYITSGYRDLPDPARNITIRNMRSVNPVGSAFVGDTDVYDVTLINFTSVNGGIQCGDCLNFTVINATLTYSGTESRWQKNTWNIYWLNGFPCENCYMIDSTFHYLTTESGVRNAKTINTQWQDVIDGRHYRANFYYADILVTDSTNNSISNATIILSNNVNASIQSTDGYGNVKTTFTTDETGYVSLPNTNRANSPAISQYDVNASNQKTYHTWTAGVYDTNNIWTNITQTIYPNGTILQQQPLAQVTDILPNASWYRINPDIPTNTISLQINYTKTSIMVNTSAETTITVNNFNASAAKGEILANFTSDTIDGNNVTFTANLKPYASYLIKRDNVNHTVLQADSIGRLSFNNSVW